MTSPGNQKYYASQSCDIASLNMLIYKPLG